MKTIDSVLAIGGGSVMDLAKVALAFLNTNEKEIHKLITYKGYSHSKKPSIFIPTTHGTASEVTMWGTIWDMENKKYSISNYSLYPDIAIIDGQLTLSLPLKTSIITVMDALSHSFEAIWNKNNNPTSTKYAIEAISMILSNVLKLKQNPQDLEIRKKLLKASTIAGLAFSNTTTAAAHSISYPLTIHYDIPHGAAASITLLPLLDINKSQITKALTKIYDKLRISHFELLNIISTIPKGVIPISLSEWGIPKSDIYNIASESFTKGRMENNIIDLTEEDVIEILLKIYK